MGFNHINYDPKSGKFTFNKGARSGKECGSVNHKGYRMIYSKGKTYPAHKVAFVKMGLPMPKYPDQEVDHRNGNRDDNRWSNLRLVDGLANRRNKCRNRNNKSGVTGVSWTKRFSKWYVSISSEGKTINLGYYRNKDAAIVCRKMAERVLGYHSNHGRA